MTMPYTLCSSTASRISTSCRGLVVGLACASLAGCSTADPVGAIGSAADSALGVVGLKRASADTTSGFDEIALRIHAARNVNASLDDKGTALVVHVYRLRSIEAFLAMSPESALLPAKEKEVLGADLVDVREIVLTPNQRLDLKEKVARDTAFIAVAGQFRNPAPQRWRVAFERGPAAKTGVMLGAHGCAFSVSAGTPIGWKADQPSRLASARCGASDTEPQ